MKSRIYASQAALDRWSRVAMLLMVALAGVRIVAMPADAVVDPSKLPPATLHPIDFKKDELPVAHRPSPIAKPKHWAFTPPTRPPEPKVKATKWPRNAIDRFVLARQEKENLTPSPEAERGTLIRRLNFDLLGLPPTPSEVADFVADPSPDAYDKLVERLLASPHYGERWGRHWLDIAGYADSNGYFSADSDRPLAYKYRDYVIKAFNDDMPFDRFILEQIAGDELVGFQPDGDMTPEMVEPLIATHFIRNGPDGTGESDGNEQEVRADRYAVLESAVQIIGSTFFGLTVQCARCHNHKFEPVTQEEYYQLQAVLKPVFNHDRWVKPQERLFTIGTRAERDENKRQIEKYAREMKALKDSREGLTAPFRKLAHQENLEMVSEPLRTDLKKALDTNEKERTEAMKSLLKTNEAVVQIKDEDLAKRYPEFAAGFRSLKEAIQKKEPEKPKPLPQLAAVHDATPEPPPHHLLLRGNYGSTNRPVLPGVPAILCTPNNPFVVAADARRSTLNSKIQNPKSKIEPSSHDAGSDRTSGRRLAFARWLTSPENPVVARLIVNRLWQHHFGAGLVASSDNFGITGAKPTHPELLDWLATEFIQSGWSVKSLNRLIVTSATFRQASVAADVRRRTSNSEIRNQKSEIRNDQSLSRLAGSAATMAGETDPENRLLWRYPLRRLDAEAVRDAMLFTSGELDLKLGGPYTPTKVSSEGQVIVEESHPGAKRRSAYLQQRRTQPLTLLDVFDAPQQQPNCTRRNPSTVSLQSLALLNSEFARARSRAFAKRVTTEAGPDELKRLELAFYFAYGRAPKASELSAAREFFQSQPAHYAGKSNADEAAWTDFCQMLLGSNTFLYVE